MTGRHHQHNMHSNIPIPTWVSWDNIFYDQKGVINNDVTINAGNVEQEYYNSENNVYVTAEQGKIDST